MKQTALFVSLFCLAAAHVGAADLRVEALGRDDIALPELVCHESPERC